MADDGYEDTGDSSEPHWITEVYVVDQHGDIITMQSLNPTDLDIAQITFAIPPNTTTLTAYVSIYQKEQDNCVELILSPFF